LIPMRYLAYRGKRGKRQYARYFSHHLPNGRRRRSRSDLSPNRLVDELMNKGSPGTWYREAIAFCMRHVSYPKKAIPGLRRWQRFEGY
jgi:hypothetical protein